MYVNKNPYHLGQLFKMHERCSQCGTKYKIEPSFFYGAMYVSYGLGVAFGVGVFIIAYLMFGISLINTFIAIVITLMVFLPIIIRLSRNIWINLFINYDPEAGKTI